MHRSFAFLAGIVLACAAVLPQASFAGAPETGRARDAVAVLDKVMRIPEQSIPQSMLDNAHAIAIVPNVVKAGFVVGGRFGRGLISVRGRDGTWSNPSFVTLAGGSFGFQAGVQSTDVVLVFVTQHGVDSIVHGKFTLGVDASIAAGPVGRTAEAATDGKLRAEIYSYSRARGLFAGVAFDGAVMKIDSHSNEAVYGPYATARGIFDGRVSNPPAPIVDFRDRLEEYSASKRYRPTDRNGAAAPAQSEVPPPQPAQTQPLDGH